MNNKHAHEIDIITPSKENKLHTERTLFYMNTNFNNDPNLNNDVNNTPNEANEQTQYQTPYHASNDTQNNGGYNPFEKNTQSYTTYEQWQAQQNTVNVKKHRKISKKPFIAVGCVAAAAAIFLGGLAVGSNGFPVAGNNSSVSSSANKNLPTLNISSTPKDESEAADGSVLTGKQIFDKLDQSVVAIQSMDATGQAASSGSGVVMSKDGYIVTNAHVINDEDTNQPMSNISVLFSDGSQLAATVVGSDTQTDLAVIKVTPENDLVPAEFGDSDSLQVGETAYAIGSPGGVQLANTMTDGIISAINRDITVNDRVMSLIQTNVTINPGNSGGALINQYGQVIGITSAKLGISYYEGLGFAIPINSAKEIVDELIVNGYIAGRPSIGITGGVITEQMAQFRNLPMGVQIASIDSRAKAASEGLMVGDVITAVNGTKITTMDEINEIKEDMKAGDKLRLTVYRPSQQKSLDITITLTDAHDLEGTDPATQQQQQYNYNQGNNGSTYIDPFQYFFGY